MPLEEYELFFSLFQLINCSKYVISLLLSEYSRGNKQLYIWSRPDKQVLRLQFYERYWPPPAGTLD